MASLLNSDSVGDPGAFLTLEHLLREFDGLSPAPRNEGRLVQIVSRGEGGLRETPRTVLMTPESGMPGDAWGRQRRPHVEAQLAVMQANVATLIANGQPLALFGDQLFLDLDLSASNLSAGSRLRAGAVVFEVTPMPHTGCRKFRARFGEGALRFVSKPDLKPFNLRGVYLRVVESGEVGVGDVVTVLSRHGS